MNPNLTLNLTLLMLVIAVLALSWFLITFWRGDFYGEFGEYKHTTTLSNFYLDQSKLPEGWFIEQNRGNYISLGQRQSGGCLVEAEKLLTLETQPKTASQTIEKQFDQSIQELRSKGYDISLLDSGETVLGGSNDRQYVWPSSEIEGSWIDDTMYFRQSNAVMAGDGYWLRVGQSCLHPNLTPALEALKAIRFS